MTDVRPEAQTQAPPSRRRIDRLLSEAYLAGLGELALATLRERRREAEQEDSDLTYRCALARGRLDLAGAEAVRRAGGSAAEPPLVTRLPEILGSRLQHGTGSGRFPRVQPNVIDTNRRLEDRLLTEAAAVDLARVSDEDLSVLVASLVELDSVLSRRQGRVHGVFELLSAELTRRYRDGGAKVDDLLLGPDVGP